MYLVFKIDPFIRDYNVADFPTTVYDNISECRLEDPDKCFGVFHQNIRSLAKNFETLEVALNQFQNQFDCIVLTETWRIHNTEFFNMPNFNLIYNNGDINQNDGVVVYLSDSLDFVADVVMIGLCRAVQIRITLNSKTIMLTAVYRPPSTSESDFISGLYTYLSQLEDRCDAHMFIGDININLFSDNNITDDYLDVLSEFNFISTVNRSTRGNSCIDHIFLKTIEMSISDICKTYVVETHLTDHRATVLTLNFDERIVNNLKQKRAFNRINMRGLKHFLNNFDWTNFYTGSDVLEITKYFIKTISDAVASNTVKIVQNRKLVKRKKWITPGIMNSISRRDRLYQLSKKQPNDNMLRQNFVSYRNILNRLIKKSKDAYHREQIEKNKSNSKKLWEIINEVGPVSREKNAVTIKKVFNSTGRLTESTFETAETFVEFFTNVGPNLRAQIVKPETAPPKRVINEHSLFLSPTNEKEILNIISSLKNHKSPGVDNITAETLKEISTEIASPLSFLMNKILETGICPPEFKIAIIKPVFKRGDREIVSNYRPISLITNFTKIFEKIIKVRIESFIKKYNLISGRQYGFQAGLSSEGAISALTRKMYDALDKGQPSLCMFVDLAKAFDTVDHSQLLGVLEDFGFRGEVLGLFESYLSSRQQLVQIGDQRSETRFVKCGVPQGTILGPVLFIIYVNSLFSLETCGEVISFADDTSVFYTSDTWSSLREMVEADFGMVVDWFSHRLLTVNVEKTKYLPLTNHRNLLPDFASIEIRNQNNKMVISPANSVEYLGITIDSHLRWNFHVNRITKTIRSMIYKFKHLARFLNFSHMKMIYQALVHSRLMYGILGWGGVAVSYLRRLEVVQKLILKIILRRDRRYSSDLVYRESKVMDIRQIFFFKLGVYSFKNRHVFRGISHDYQTSGRAKKNLLIPSSQRTVGQRSHYFLAPRVYNFLPPNIREESSINRFKPQLREFVFSVDRNTVVDIIDVKNKRL